MGQSLKEYIKSFKNWFLGTMYIVLFLVSVVGIFIPLVSEFEYPLWGWFVIVLLVYIVTFIVFHKLRVTKDEIQKQLEELQEAKPSIKVSEEEELSKYYLEVTNNGERGIFKAQIEIVEGKNFVTELPVKYFSYWERTQTDEIEIYKGQSERLFVAHNMTNGTDSLCLMLHYFESIDYEGLSTGQTSHAQSISWELNEKDEKPLILLKVNISANPSLKEGIFCRTYKLSNKGFSTLNRDNADKS